MSGRGGLGQCGVFAMAVLPLVYCHYCHLFSYAMQTVLSFLSYPVEIDAFKLTRNTFVNSANEILK